MSTELSETYIEYYPGFPAEGRDSFGVTPEAMELAWVLKSDSPEALRRWRS